MLKTLSIIVLLDSLGLNPGFVLTPLARSDSTQLTWDRYSRPRDVQHFLLYASPDSSAFTLTDTLGGGHTTRARVYLPPQGHWLYITAWHDSLGESGPSNVVYLEAAPSFVRYFHRPAPPSYTRTLILDFGPVPPQGVDLGPVPSVK